MHTVDVNKLEILCQHLMTLPQMVRGLQQTPSQGFIYLKNPPVQAKSSKPAKDAAPAGADGSQGEKPAEEEVYYAETVPIVLAQHASRECRAFPTFLKAVDEYFSKVENQRLEAQKLRLAAADAKHLAKVHI